MKRSTRLASAATLLCLMLTGCGTKPSPPAAADLARSTQRPWSELDAATLRSKISRLLPANVKDRNGWASDLQNAYSNLNIPPSPGSFCASIAVIEQESNFQADPVVQGLPAIVQQELDQRAAKYGIPKFLVHTAMLKASPDGRSYRDRVDALKTEKQLNDLFEEMIAGIPFGARWLTGYNPIRTAGSMQVSVRFAEQHASEKSYPYPIGKSLRDEVFTRRGGIYFGAAILLDYPAPYDDIVYRFADFNAGRYSSRNAAFQSALAKLSGKTLTLDGDLLRYQGGKAVDQPSSVETVLRGLSAQLRLSAGDIRRDLLLEKSANFGQSPLFGKLFALADKSAGQPLPRQVMPQIDLKSPKITRKLTTEWFARRVEGRYRSCLARGEGSN